MLTWALPFSSLSFLSVRPSSPCAQDGGGAGRREKPRSLLRGRSSEKSPVLELAVFTSLQRVAISPDQLLKSRLVLGSTSTEFCLGNVPESVDQSLHFYFLLLC